MLVPFVAHRHYITHTLHTCMAHCILTANFKPSQECSVAERCSILRPTKTNPDACSVTQGFLTVQIQLGQ